jgi:hypothetical protein
LTLTTNPTSHLDYPSPQYLEVVEIFHGYWILKLLIPWLDIDLLTSGGETIGYSPFDGEDNKMMVTPSCSESSPVSYLAAGIYATDPSPSSLAESYSSQIVQLFVLSSLVQLTAVSLRLSTCLPHLLLHYFLLPDHLCLIGLSRTGMPTSTVPFEVLFELTNDSPYDGSSLQLIRGDQGVGGPTVYLNRQESVSLVLNAGTTYHYAIRHQGRKILMYVRIWQDMHCPVSKLLTASSSSQARHLAQKGITLSFDTP